MGKKTEIENSTVENDNQETQVSKKKIDNYVAPVSPNLAEIQALTQFFNSSIGTVAETQEVAIATEKQINYPALPKGYELAFDYDENPSTATLHTRLKTLVKGMNGTVSEPSVFGGSCSLSVQLPINLEEATAFFDKFLKVQFNNGVKMSGSIYQKCYAFTATADEEKIKEIKSEWVKFSHGGQRRELVQSNKYLTMTFASAEDFENNSSILGLSDTVKDGVKFTTDITHVTVKEAMNYNPKRAITPD